LSDFFDLFSNSLDLLGDFFHFLGCFDNLFSDGLNNRHSFSFFGNSFDFFGDGFNGLCLSIDGFSSLLDFLCSSVGFSLDLFNNRLDNTGRVFLVFNWS
jgi:hypothetical protein